MVKLRLRRRGRKRLPVYDIVAADSRSPRDGRIIERIGQYNPLITSGATMLDRERALHWIQTGAQPTQTVRNILSREGILLEAHMGYKGASAEEISTAVDAHILRYKSREAIKTKAKEAPKAEEVPAEETPAEEVAAEEAPAVEAEAEGEAESPVAQEAAETTEAAPDDAVATTEEEATSSETEAEVVSNDAAAAEVAEATENEKVDEESDKSAE